MVLFSYELQYLDRLIERHETSSNNFSSIINLRFKIDYNLPIESRINLSFSSVPFKKIADDYIIGSHIDSLFFIYKRSHHQDKINRINIKYILKLSQKPYSFEPRLIEEFKSLKITISHAYDLINKFRDVSNELMMIQRSIPSTTTLIKQAMPFLATVAKLSQNDRILSEKKITRDDINIASKALDDLNFLKPDDINAKFDISSLSN